MQYSELQHNICQLNLNLNCSPIYSFHYTCHKRPRQKLTHFFQYLIEVHYPLLPCNIIFAHTRYVFKFSPWSILAHSKSSVLQPILLDGVRNPWKNSLLFQDRLTIRFFCEHLWNYMSVTLFSTFIEAFDNCEIISLCSLTSCINSFQCEVIHLHYSSEINELRREFVFHLRISVDGICSQSVTLSYHFLQLIGI